MKLPRVLMGFGAVALLVILALFLPKCGGRSFDTRAVDDGDPVAAPILEPRSPTQKPLEQSIEHDGESRSSTPGMPRRSIVALVVTVTVLDDSAGTPLTGVEVAAQFGWQNAGPVSSRVVQQQTSGSGTVEARLELTEELPPSSFGCTVTAACGGFSAASVHVPKADFKESQAETSTWTANLCLRLHRVFRIKGQVVDESGGTIAGANVLLAKRPGVDATPQSLSHAVSDGAGTFEVESREWVTDGLVLVIRADGHLPRMVGTAMDMEGVHEQGRVVLDRGARIVGRVVGLPEPLDCRLEVNLRPQSKVGSMFIDGDFGMVVLAGSEVHPVDLRAAVRSDGTFEAAGALSIEYAVGVVGDYCDVSVRSIQPLWIKAPCDDVRIDSVAAWYHLQVVDAANGAALEMAVLDLESPASLRCSLGKLGSRVISVDPGVVLLGTVTAAGYSATQVELPALGISASGAASIRLEKAKSAGSRKFRIVDPSGRPVTHVQIALEPLRVSTRTVRQFSYSDNADGVHVLPPMPPRRCLVTVEACTQANRWDSILMSTSIEVDGAAELPLIDVVLEEGGFLQFVVSESSGHAFECAVELSKAMGGTPVECSWLVRGPPTSIRNGAVPGATSVRSLCPLAPGEYRLSIARRGFQPVVRDVKIIVGETADVEVQLEPLRER